LHTLTLAGRARDRRIVRSHVQVRVVNKSMLPAKIVSSSLADGQTVSGTQHWLVAVSGSVARVEFSVDGLPQATLDKGPYAYDWNTSEVTPGTHQLSVRATGIEGDAVTKTITVTVAAPSAQ
jgi:hypothetical protein